MAGLHNALHRAGWLIAGVRRMIGAGGDVAIERLGETLTPIINPWGLPEWAYLRGEWLWSHRITAAAGPAGEESFVAIANPANSGLITVIDAVFNGSGIRAFLMYMTRTDLAATGTQGNAPQNRDLRWQRNPVVAGSNPPVEGWSGSDPTFPLNSIVDQASAGTEFHAPPFVLRPGTALVMQGETAATAIEAVFVGRTRKALPGELE